MLPFFSARQESDISTTKLKDMARKLKLKLGKHEDKEENHAESWQRTFKDKIVQLIDESKPISRANLSITIKDNLNESNRQLNGDIKKEICCL